MFIIDAHFDLACEVELKRRVYGEKQVIKNHYLDEFKKGGFTTIVSSIFINDGFLPEMGLRKALDQVSALLLDIDETKEELMFCKNYNDILKAKEENKIGILLSFEGLEPIGNDPALLRMFYELGVRMAGLVWSRRNYVGDGCFFEPREEGKKGGLTDFGVKVIKEMDRLGMIIDISHLNDEGVEDVFKYSRNPIIASHSNVRNITGSMRNLTDEQLLKIKNSGGVVGINCASVFVSEKDETADIPHLIDHLEYMINKIGIEHVGLGFDFCDKLTDVYPPAPPVPGRRYSFDSFKGHGEFIKFDEEMKKRGFKEEQLEMIYGKNFLRIYQQILK